MFRAIILIEAICFLFSVYFLGNARQVVWKSMKWIVLFNLAAELSLSVIGRVYHQHNIWLVNIYTLINFLVTNWLLLRLSPVRKSNDILFRYAVVAFTFVFITEIIFRGFFEYTLISNLFSDVFFLIICNRFFYLLLKEDAWIDIRRHAAFWIVTGIFLFNFCAIIADVFDDQLTSLYIFPNVSLYYLLYLVLNLILYSCWSYAFICKYQEMT